MTEEDLKVFEKAIHNLFSEFLIQEFSLVICDESGEAIEFQGKREEDE